MTADWPGYLDEFHQRYAGYTEQVLKRCTAGRLTPYAWIIRPVAGRGRQVLDLACGSGAVTAAIDAESGREDVGTSGPQVVGVDRSMAELALAHQRHGARVVCADATALPFAPGSFDAAVCSMGLMVVQPLAATLTECARVLRPGGMLAATVASAVPLRPSDLVILGPLTARLRTPPQFPGGGELAGLTDGLAEAGFDLMEDARERFVFRVHGPRDAELLFRALYLPDVPDERRNAALQWLADRGRNRPDGVEVAIPIRRVIALRR
ncbi:class I SAM-dependent methyltransferase [Actinopolymorpha sp. B11F2]|uniref:class I SAM-dependent methyltransferase n=1 Tax=Actinopolymorpha sp. B11F2 TaxID=3160862 RepID=UPI0032E4CD6F